MFSAGTEILRKLSFGLMVVFVFVMAYVSLLWFRKDIQDNSKILKQILRAVRVNYNNLCIEDYGRNQ